MTIQTSAMRRNNKHLKIILLLATWLSCGLTYAQKEMSSSLDKVIHTEVYNSVQFAKFGKTSFAAGKSDGRWLLTQYSGNGDVNWELKDGITDRYSEIAEITIGPLGNIYMIGYFKETIKFPVKRNNNTDFYTLNSTNGANTDVFVACYTPKGRFKWANNYGQNLNDIGMSISAGKDCLYTASIYTEDGVATDITPAVLLGDSKMVIRRISFDGQLLNTVVGLSNNTIIDVSNESDHRQTLQKLKVDILAYEGKVYVVSPFADELALYNTSNNLINSVSNPNNQNRAIALMCFDEGLNLDWGRYISNDQSETEFGGLSVAADCNGVFIAGGMHKDPTITFKSQYLTFTDPPTDIRFQWNRNYTIIVKFSFDGNFEWIYSMGCTFPETGYNRASFYDINATQKGKLIAVGNAATSLFGDYYIEGQAGSNSGSFPNSTNESAFELQIFSSDGTFIDIQNFGDSQGYGGGYAVATKHIDAQSFKSLAGAKNITSTTSELSINFSADNINPIGLSSCCAAGTSVAINVSPPLGTSCPNNILLSNTNFKKTHWQTKINGENKWKYIGYGSAVRMPRPYEQFTVKGTISDICGEREDTLTVNYTNTSPDFTVKSDTTIYVNSSCDLSNIDIPLPKVLTPGCIYFTDTLITEPTYQLGSNPVSYEVKGIFASSEQTITSRTENGFFPFPYPLNTTSESVDVNGSQNKVFE